MKSFRADPDAPMAARRFSAASPAASTAMLRLAFVALAVMALALALLATR